MHKTILKLCWTSLEIYLHNLKNINRRTMCQRKLNSNLFTTGTEVEWQVCWPSLVPNYNWTCAHLPPLNTNVIGSNRSNPKTLHLPWVRAIESKPNLTVVGWEHLSINVTVLARTTPLIGQTCCSHFPQHDSSNLFIFFFVASNGDAKGKWIQVKLYILLKENNTGVDTNLYWKWVLYVIKLSHEFQILCLLDREKAQRLFDSCGLKTTTPTMPISVHPVRDVT